MPNRRFSPAATGARLAAVWEAKNRDGKSVPQYAAECALQTTDPTTPQASLGSALRPATLLTLAAATFMMGFAGMVLSMRHAAMMAWLHDYVQTLLVAIGRTLFPTTTKWRRTYLPLEIMFTAFLMTNAAIEISRFPKSKRSRILVSCLPERERRVLRNPGQWGRHRCMLALAFFFSRQVYALDPASCDNKNEGLLYLFANDRVSYLGKANVSRQGEKLRTGAVTRAIEHFSHRAYPSGQEGQRRRYRLSRCTGYQNHLFAVLRAEPLSDILDWERCAINMYHPNGNEKKKKRNRRGGLHRKRGQTARKHGAREHQNSAPASNTSPLENLVSTTPSIVERTRQSKLEKEKSFQMWAQGFTESYFAAQKARLRKTGQEGPIHIYGVAHRSLLIKYLAKQGTTVDWKRVQKFWGEHLCLPLRSPGSTSTTATGEA